jgi:hypothetical protein
VAPVAGPPTAPDGRRCRRVRCSCQTLLRPAYRLCSDHICEPAAVTPLALACGVNITAGDVAAGPPIQLFG